MVTPPSSLPRGRGGGINEDYICGSVISLPSVGNGFWMRLRRTVSSVAKKFLKFVFT